MPRSAAPLILLLALAACTPDVVFVDPDALADFKPGKTNETEVIAALGKPMHVVSEADGTKIDEYPYSHGEGTGSVIPYWLGGPETPPTYTMLSFQYTSSGVLKSIDGK